MVLNGKIYLKTGTNEYPLLSILVIFALILLSPFVSTYLCYAAFLICIYRMVRYDAKVFSTDYCVLIAVSQIFKTTNGMSLLIWLCLIAAIWYFVRGKIRVNAAFVLLLLILNYLIARMQMNINDFVLCFGQLFLLYVLLPKQDAESSERTIRAFCVSLFIGSFYALIMRNTPQMLEIRGPEVVAFWGSSLKRFQGLFTDPNYYMALLIVAIALLAKLKECKRISTGHFLAFSVSFSLFGILTYSKTFILVFALLVVVYLVWQFLNKKYIVGIFMTLAFISVVAWLLLSENSLISVVLHRLMSADTLSELTTGRTDIYSAYWTIATKDIGTTLFGVGLNAPMLTKDPHNLYLEIIYRVGFLGLGLMLAFCGSVIGLASRTVKQKQNVISKYLVLLMIIVVYFTLHGMTSMFSYASFFLACLAMMLTKMKEASK